MNSTRPAIYVDPDPAFRSFDARQYRRQETAGAHAYRVVAGRSERRRLILEAALFLAVVFFAVIALSFVGVALVPAVSA